MTDEELVEAMARALDKALADSLMRRFQALSSPPVPGRVIPPVDGKAVIRAALTALRSAGYVVVPADDWRPIETLDRKPRKDGAVERVLVWCDTNGRCVVEINSNGSLSPVPVSPVKLNPTYWQPIPARPARDTLTPQPEG